VSDPALPGSMSDAEASLLQAVSSHARAELAPLAARIDEEGLYPEAWLRRLGELGGFSAAIAKEWGGPGLDLSQQIDVTTLVGRECGATAFLVWCQSTCAWYLQHAPNEAVRTRYLAPVARGELLSGTGMSNPVKHLAGIERMHLAARPSGEGYSVSGALPWVSNIGPGHLVVAAAALEGGGYVMFAARGGADGVELHPCPAFAGLEGTQTLNVRFKDAYVPAEDVLAHPQQFTAFIQRIKPGFVLGQAGIGFGVVEASLKTIRECNASHAHVNAFLDDQGAELETELADLRTQVRTQARQAQAGRAEILPALKLRARTSELALKAANSAVLHAGAKGYLMRHPAQRRLREAVFVAIVTPALKHLRKEIQDLERARQPA
jgi:alkylation response protein AidB-like acyl-CoA dehydrogenase